MAGEFNADLIKAVQYLYGIGRIKADKDIVEDLDYSKSTVSAYLNGDVKASGKFLEKFEKKYGVNLDHFHDESSNIVLSESDFQNLLISKITKLEAAVELLLALKAEELAGTHVSVEKKKLEFDELLKDKISKIQALGQNKTS